jgi:hypothetical protein
MPIDDEFGEFGGFGGFGKLPWKATQVILPDDVFLQGENPSGDIVPMLLDADTRLIIEVSTPIYYARSPIAITTSLTELYEPADDGITHVITQINVVNVNAAARTFSLYWSEDDPPTTADLFAARNLSVAANSLYTWTGNLAFTYGEHTLWGQASAASSLYMHISLRAQEQVYR